MEGIKAGMRIAVCVGSRGIAAVPILTATVIAELKRRGAAPFIIPAMGSHGGATAEGQIEMLASLGVTEAACGAPVVSSMEVHQIGEARVAIQGDAVDIPLYLDANALDADGIILVQRIKPHTAFRGPYESGLCKMLTIGLGKHVGAMGLPSLWLRSLCAVDAHRRRGGPQEGPSPVRRCGLGERLSRSRTCRGRSRQRYFEPRAGTAEGGVCTDGRLYFDHLDALVVEEIGKNFSGDGMDPNITGAYPTPYAGKGLNVESRVALRLSEESHGSAIGLGMADFSTIHAFLQADPIATYTNAMTARVLGVAKLPLLMPDDETAIKAAIYKSNSLTADFPRIVKIKNTANVERVEISEALWPEAEAHPDVTLEGEPYTLRFGSDRMLLPSAGDHQPGQTLLMVRPDV